MSDKPCKVCSSAKPAQDHNGNYTGFHECMICREKFIKVSVCGKCQEAQAEKQLPVGADVVPLEPAA